MQQPFALIHCGATELLYFYHAKRYNGAMDSSIVGRSPTDCLRPRFDFWHKADIAALLIHVRFWG